MLQEKRKKLHVVHSPGLSFGTYTSCFSLTNGLLDSGCDAVVSAPRAANDTSPPASHVSAYRGVTCVYSSRQGSGTVVPSSHVLQTKMQAYRQNTIGYNIVIQRTFHPAPPRAEKVALDGPKAPHLHPEQQWHSLLALHF